ncbi:MAG TPA: hypothetical protein VL501_04275 [Pyrinomonadaceae bacterium]|nr:hypothetical protein [Pyrinomonadaceae bacterium]
MKNYGKKNFAIWLAVIVLIGTAAMQMNINGQAGADQSADRIVGAWETTITPVNCDTGEQIAPNFYGNLTFNEGGTLAEFGANPAVPYRTPGHGIWSSQGGRGPYTMKFSFLALTPAGAPVGRMRITQVIELPKFSDTFTTYGSFALSNLAGNVIATGCSTSVAVRVN